MTKQIEGELVVSRSDGRLALNNSQGPELYTGRHIEVCLGGHWITGRVEHAIAIYPGKRSSLEVSQHKPVPAYGGYFFEAAGGTMCGLCVGMQVRLEVES